MSAVTIMNHVFGINDLVVREGYAVLIVVGRDGFGRRVVGRLSTVSILCVLESSDF